MASTDSILAGKYPAKAHARKVAEYLRRNGHNTQDGVIYLEAQKTRMIEDNDEPVPFRYEDFFSRNSMPLFFEVVGLNDSPGSVDLSSICLAVSYPTRTWRTTSKAMN